MRIWPGQPYPLGATWDGEGVNFALFSESASGVDLCLFDDPNDAVESHRIPLKEYTDQVWHCYLPDVRPGQLYGYRVHGAYRPEDGLRFNPAQLLIDPHAKAISGRITWSDAVFAYRVGNPREDLEINPENSAGRVPKCVVINSAFEWGNDRLLHTPWNRTVIYECHVKGMTIRHPNVPERLRGTYLGLVYDDLLDYFLSLGITAVELLPVHQFIVDRHLWEKDLTNYWGYNSIGYFAPEVRYATGGRGIQVHEFKSMVKTFHSAGIEVILDVVYNHTGEGNHLGPTLSLRGIDNPAFYRLVPENPRYYMDFTGTGNTLNMQHPRTVQLIMDSLRYWVLEMHVDGFRFDLAAALARELYDVNRLGTFFDIIHQDPILSQVKLIAEPWDVGPGGYQVGNFPVGWAEWNGKYRDSVRRFWRGDAGHVGELASRLAGSADIYQWTHRSAYASVNFIAAHDGFTLNDLVSYNHKHNEDNGEQNRDGQDDNFSRNWGHEGPTDDPEIIALRYQMMRNLLATLVFSQGVPMISHGDEVARTQRGNNNAYCQDNEITWVDWDLDERRGELLEFTRKILAIRQTNPVLRRRRFFRGQAVGEAGFKDVTWLRRDGLEMTQSDWHDGADHVLGMMIDGAATDETDARGRPMRGDTLLLLLNAGAKATRFRLPGQEARGHWEVLVDTASEPDTPELAGRTLTLQPRSLALLAYNREREPRMGVASRAADTLSTSARATLRSATTRRASLPLLAPDIPPSGRIHDW